MAELPYYFLTPIFRLRVGSLPARNWVHLGFSDRLSPRVDVVVGAKAKGDVIYDGQILFAVNTEDKA